MNSNKKNFSLIFYSSGLSGDPWKNYKHKICTPVSRTSRKDKLYNKNDNKWKKTVIIIQLNYEITVKMVKQKNNMEMENLHNYECAHWVRHITDHISLIEGGP